MNVYPFVLAYLLGAFPTGRLVARSYGVQIEKTGSGNVGATNVARTLGKKPGLITLLGDVTKGALALLLGRVLGVEETLEPLIALTVVAGHCMSIPPLLRGGKGVATALGGLLALNPILALAALATFAAIFSVYRLVSLASVLAAISVGVAGLFHTSLSAQCALLGISALVIIRHSTNIKRLVAGTEGRFTLSAQKQEKSSGNSTP